MKTKLTMIDDTRNRKLNETLVRDRHSRQLKVKTNVRAGKMEQVIIS